MVLLWDCLGIAVILRWDSCDWGVIGGVVEWCIFGLVLADLLLLHRSSFRLLGIQAPEEM